MIFVFCSDTVGNICSGQNLTNTKGSLKPVNKSSKEPHYAVYIHLHSPYKQVNMTA